MAKSPTEADSLREPVSSQDEAAKSFERQTTIEERSNKNKKENQPKKTEKEASKRPLSTSSSSSVSNPPKQKTGTDDHSLLYLTAPPRTIQTAVLISQTLNCLRKTAIMN